MVDDTLMSEAEAAARALLDRRIGLIRELTAATAELEPLQRAAAEGEQRVRDAWADALAGGWTADELRSLGVPEPERKAAGKKTAPKPRPAPASSAATVSGAAGTESGGGEPGGGEPAGEPLADEPRADGSSTAALPGTAAPTASPVASASSTEATPAQA